MNRRMYLAIVGATVSGSLAGCMGAADESPMRPFGEKQHRNNIAMAATATESTDEITVTNETLQPEDDTFTLVRFWAENLVDDQRHLPTTAETTLTVSGTEYDPRSGLNDWSQGYRGGTVDPGELRQGFIVFDTPAGTLDGDVTFTISPVASDFSAPVHWTIP